MAKSLLRKRPLLTEKSFASSLIVLSIAAYFTALPLASAEPSLSANAAITSDYVFRGQTQSDNGIAAQGGIDYTHESEFYLGAWTSTVSGSGGNTGGGLEVDLYAGWAHSWDDFGIDIGYITYEYTDKKFSAGTREFYVGFDWGPASITYYNGDDQTSSNPNDYNYIDVALDIEMIDDVLVSFHYGRLSPDRGNSINDFKVEASKNILDFDVGIAVTYEDGTGTPYNTTASKDTELFLTIKKSFDL